MKGSREEVNNILLFILHLNGLICFCICLPSVVGTAQQEDSEMTFDGF